MIASCLLSSALGLALGLRFRAFVLIPVNILLLLVAAIVASLVGGALTWACLCYAFSVVSLQIGYFVTARWAVPQIPVVLAAHKNVNSH